MSTTLVDAAIAVGPDNDIDLEIPTGTHPSDAAVAIVAFAAFTHEGVGDVCPGPGRYRFVVDVDGMGFVGGRVS